MRHKKILVACEFSGTVRDSFLEYGHHAVSCDLLPSSSGKGLHIQADVSELLCEEWDLVIAHPPCTYLCNSGVRWLYTQPGRWCKMVQACSFFNQCLNANAKAVCVENPIPHGKAIEIIGKRYSQIIQPWQFGCGETKATCLWLRGLPHLRATNIVSGRVGRIHNLPPSPNRHLIRSITYSGIARAMAEQWGAL